MDNISANPFVVVNPPTRIHLIKVLPMIPLAVIRILIIVLLMLMVSIISQILCIFKSMMSQTRYRVWRRCFLRVPNMLLYTAMMVAGLYCRNVVDHNKVRSKPANLLLLVPHSSFWDIFPLFRLGNPDFVARYEAKQTWLLSSFFELANPILVRRDNPISRLVTLMEIKSRALVDKIAIFPEGTCTNRQMILKFRLGAFTPALPVQLIYIHYDIQSDYDFLSWTHEGPSGAMLFAFTLLRWRTPVTLHLMPIYAPTADEQTNPALFAQNVQKYFCNFFNIRRSIYNFEDPKFMAFAKLNGMPRSPACLKLLKLFNKLAQYNRSRQEKERQERVEPATQSTSAAVESESSGSSTKATDHYENMAKGASISVIMENQATVQQHKRVEERRGSIGSLTSMLFAENWMQMLEIFLRRYYHILMPKFSAIDDLSSKTLSSAAELGEFLELPTMFPELQQSSSVTDLFEALQEADDRPVVHMIDLFLTFELCNPNQVRLAERLEICFDKLVLQRKGSKKLVNDKKTITPDQFKRLIWCLLGLDKDLLPSSLFARYEINISFIRRNLPKLFRRAVAENAADLL